MTDRSCSRRGFMRFCGSAATLATALPGDVPAAVAPEHAYAPATLVWSDGSPVTGASLEPEREFVFFYPYRSTPCFLLRLAAPAAAGMAVAGSGGRTYRWAGGVGPDRAVVAYSAICAHKLSHPSPSVSFIGYRPRPVGFLGEGNRVQRRAGVIQCCSEHSIYDPAQGASVLSGPAPYPLAAIGLDDSGVGLIAQAVHGEPVFDRYFERFGFRLGLEFGEDQFRQSVGEATVVQATEEFTRQRIQC